MPSEKKTGVKPTETEDSNRDQSATPIVVDQIETPEEMVLKDQAMARQIIASIVPVEGEIKLEQKALNRKKAFVGCLLLVSKRLAKSGTEDNNDTKTDDKAKVSIFDQMLAEQKLSRATAYRRMSFARACIDNGAITTDTLALIEKSMVATPELLSLLDASLSSPRGLKVQQDQGLLPGPDKDKPVKTSKSLKQQIDEKNEQVKALLNQIKELLADKELTQTVGDKSVLEQLNNSYTQLDTSFFKFKSLDIPTLPDLAGLKMPDMTGLKMPDFSIPSIVKP